MADLSQSAGQVLSQGIREGLTCPSCGKTHDVGGESNLSTVPQNLALLDSLRRLEESPVLGGLLLAENVQISNQKIGVSRKPAVFVSVLIQQQQETQVTKACPAGAGWCIQLCMACRCARA